MSGNNRRERRLTRRYQRMLYFEAVRLAALYRPTIDSLLAAVAAAESALNTAEAKK